jgi:uncharacterized surface protein with fasciclin (FAS1) repeats
VGRSGGQGHEQDGRGGGPAGPAGRLDGYADIVAGQQAGGEKWRGLPGSGGWEAPFGPACSSVPSSGAGSFTGMSTAPVATAASNNPVLSTLVTAVKKAGLVDTLNSAEGITVFAPDNAAFAKIPAATLAKVLASKAELTKILTYHVAAGQMTPAQLATGKPIKTLEGSTITPAKMGATYEINTAHIVCGNVHTANATVYIIDTVLMPPTP